MACCGGGCVNCTSGGGQKVEKPECTSCPNRMRCHGRRTVITDDTLVRLIADAVADVLTEHLRHR